VKLRHQINSDKEGSSGAQKIVAYIGRLTKNWLLLLFEV
jgi:hypothetical protein